MGVMTETDRRTETETERPPLARRRRRGKDVPPEQQQINAQRAYEAAQAVSPGYYSLEDYLQAYERTSRRRRARHRDRAWLLRQLQLLEEEEGAAVRSTVGDEAAAAAALKRKRH